MQMLKDIKPGFVNVEKLMSVERYSDVMHMSSTVSPYFILSEVILFMIAYSRLHLGK